MSETDVKKYYGEDLLPYTQSVRIHWSWVMVSLIGFFIAAILAIWTMFLRQYLDANPPERTFDPILLAAGISSALGGLWRLYAHFLDNAIVGLYPDLILAEGNLGFPKDTGISNQFRALSKECEKARLTFDEKAEVVRILGGKDKRRMGTRGETPLNLVAAWFILLPAPILAYSCSANLIVRSLCLGLTLIGVLAFSKALAIRQRGHTHEDVHEAIALIRKNGHA